MTWRTLSQCWEVEILGNTNQNSHEADVCYSPHRQDYWPGFYCFWTTSSGNKNQEINTPNSAPPPDLLQESLGPFGARPEVSRECPSRCLWGPSGPGLQSVQKVSRECPQCPGHLFDTFWLSGHFFGHSGARGPKGPRDTPRDTPGTLWARRARETPVTGGGGLQTKFRTKKNPFSRTGSRIGLCGLPERLFLQFPSAVALNAVVRRNTQMRAKERKWVKKNANARPQKSAKGRKRPQKRGKGRKRPQKSAKGRKRVQKSAK